MKLIESIVESVVESIEPRDRARRRGSLAKRSELRSKATLALNMAVSMVIALALVTVSAPVRAQTFDDDDEMLLLYLPAILAATRGGGGQTNSGGSGGGNEPDPEPVSTGPGVPASDAKIVVRRSGDRLTVISNAKPTWRVVFELGSGAPGGGTATSLYIPSSSSNSVVENRPYMNCCSGLGLDNLEWRWRPFGSGAGTRAALGTSSIVDSFTINSQTDRKLIFTIKGRFSGVSAFTRRTTVNVQGYSSTIDATYAGTVNQDSMWWLISMFHDDQLKSNEVTISDGNTAPLLLRKTTVGTPIPGAISFPYTINYPLKNGFDVSMTMTRLADSTGNARFYEYFDRGLLHGSINLGPYYLIYPRWTGRHQNRTYNFVYRWKFSN